MNQSTTSANGNGAGVRSSEFAPPIMNSKPDQKPPPQKEPIADLSGCIPAGTPSRTIGPDGDPVHRCSTVPNLTNLSGFNAVISFLKEKFQGTHAVEVARLWFEFLLAISGVESVLAAQTQGENERSQKETNARAKAAAATKRFPEINKEKNLASASLQKELAKTREKLMEAEVDAATLTGASGEIGPYDATSADQNYTPIPVTEEEAAGRGRLALQSDANDSVNPLTILFILVSGSALGIALGRSLGLITGSFNSLFEKGGLAPYYAMLLGISVAFQVKTGLSKVASLAGVKADLAANVLQRTAAYAPLALIIATLLFVEVAVMRTFMLMNPQVDGRDPTNWCVGLPLLLPGIICGVSEGINRGAGRAAYLRTLDVRKREHEARLREAGENPKRQEMLAARGRVSVYKARESQLLAEIEKVEAPFKTLMEWETADLSYPKELSPSFLASILEIKGDATYQALIFRGLFQRFERLIQSERGMPAETDGDDFDLTARMETLTQPTPQLKLSWWRRFINRLSKMRGKKRG